jgi:hypothetical protein
MKGKLIAAGVGAFQAFIVGGLFKVCHADRRYFYACTDCNLRNKKSCEQMRCKATERADGKDVVFVAL